MKISEFLLRTLESNGVRHIFGNPGTTEIPLVRACEKRRTPRYVVALSEVAAVPMADGYARATRSLGVVNLHVAPGLGNGMGNLYTAGIAGTPLLVLIGGQDRRLRHTEPILWGPLQAMAATVCKAVFALDNRYDAAANVRRAVRSALTPPYSPVALICPPDLLEQDIAATPAAVRAPQLAALGTADARRFALFLEKAKRPAFVAAEDVHWSDASEELERLAGLVDAPVYAAPYTGILPVSSASACYGGYLPPSMKQIAERLAAHDALVYVGGRGFRTTLYSEGKLPPHRAWLGTNPQVIAAEGELEVACVAELSAGLRAIARQLPKRASRQRSGKRWRTALQLPASQRKLHPTRAIYALLERFADALWVDESGLSTSDVRQWMQLAAGDYLINGSGGIGWGLAAAVGAAIGSPGREIVAVIGDGSALYASEALWTASRHGTKLVLVILSNRRYATLNEAARRLTGGPLETFSIEPPILDFSGLAALYGFRYARASEPAALEAFLTAHARGNTLLELVLDPAVKPITASRHF